MWSIIKGGHPMHRKHLTVWLCAVALVASLAACGRADADAVDVAERTPFDIEVVGEDGTSASLEAYSDGYRPGTTDTLRLGVRNGTDGPWPGCVCVQLLSPEPDGTVTPLAEEAFDLPSGGGWQREIEVQLPADLEPGTYGLALVIQSPTGPSTSVTTVHVGEDRDTPFTGDWPTRAALQAAEAACPTP